MDDTTAFLGKGLAFPPRVDPVTGRFVMCSGEEDIRQSVYIILMTRLNERAMMPDFGSGLHDFVFEIPDISSMALLRSEVVSSLIRWEPRIVNVAVEIDATGINVGKVVLDISYTVRATNNPGNLVFPYYLYEGVGVE
jgi:phage baseplate assembly protein W